MQQLRQSADLDAMAVHSDAAQLEAAGQQPWSTGGARTLEVRNRAAVIACTVVSQVLHPDVCPPCCRLSTLQTSSW